MCGKPLIAYSIELAIKLKEDGIVSRVVVSTDSDKYAVIARQFGAEVPFLRPKNISTDTSKSAELIAHALDFFEEKDILFDSVILLQPTSPIRKKKQLEKAIKMFERKNADSLISCYEEGYVNDLVMYRKNKSGYLFPLNPLHNAGIRKQNHKKVFIRNGNLYITETSYFKKTGRIISDRPLLFRMSKIESANVDSVEDLELVRLILCKSA